MQQQELQAAKELKEKLEKLQLKLKQNQVKADVYSVPYQQNKLQKHYKKNMELKWIKEKWNAMKAIRSLGITKFQ